LTALDLSKSRAADQILAAVSAVVMKAGVNGAGVNVLLSQTASDLADDGVLNNSTNYRTSVQSKLCAAAAVTDFADVATNLNSLYGTTYLATDLSQWVDTSGSAGPACLWLVVEIQCRFTRHHNISFKNYWVRLRLRPLAAFVWVELTPVFDTGVLSAEGHHYNPFI